VDKRLRELAETMREFAAVEGKGRGKKDEE